MTPEAALPSPAIALVDTRVLDTLDDPQGDRLFRRMRDLMSPSQAHRASVLLITQCKRIVAVAIAAANLAVATLRDSENYIKAAEHAVAFTR